MKKRYIRIAASSVFFIMFVLMFFGVRKLRFLFGLQLATAGARAVYSFTVGPAVAVISIIVLTLFFGRLYCAVLCPLGILQDVFSAGKKYKYRPLRPVWKYAVFSAVTGMILLGFALPAALLLPSSNFPAAVNNLFVPAVWKFLSLLGAGKTWYVREPEAGAAAVSLATMIFIFLLVRWRGRIYCNLFCPVGVFLSFFSRRPVLRISLDGNKCVSCGACVSVCKAMCIDIKTGTVHNESCLMCFNCEDICPKGAIRYVRPPGVKSAGCDSTRRELLSAAGCMAAGAVVGGMLKKASSAVRTDSSPVMPPGAGNSAIFHSKCLGCGVCISKCSGKVLKASVKEYGLVGFMQPVMGHDRGFCRFGCTACMRSCPSHSLNVLTPAEKKHWRVGLAVFTPADCIAYRYDRDCGACAEHCPVGSIDMIPYKNTRIPSINDRLCIGCGACRHICPAVPEKAIRVEGVSEQYFVDVPETSAGEKLKAEKGFPF